MRVIINRLECALELSISRGQFAANELNYIIENTGIK